MKYKLLTGSNQYHYRHAGLSREAYKSIAQVLAITLVGVILCNLMEKSQKPISPLPNSPSWRGGIVYAKEDKSELEEITAYIVKTFEPEGRSVATWALACFISESGLRPEAYGYNTNNTADVGIAQINDVHGMTVEERKDWKANINKAYQIYKHSGKSAWYGRYCK